MIDTGDERSVMGHAVSGSIVAGVLAGSINYNQYKKADISQKEFLAQTAKTTIQGGVGTASAVATANAIGKGDYVGALTAISLGVVGVYAAEKLYEKLENKETIDAK
jgi:uncharacterized membrane protein YeaQ/YmgE (transglycosylase-associated protein family)